MGRANEPACAALITPSGRRLCTSFALTKRRRSGPGPQTRPVVDVEHELGACRTIRQILGHSSPHIVVTSQSQSAEVLISGQALVKALSSTQATSQGHVGVYADAQ
jgi:hypothetical protein